MKKILALLMSAMLCVLSFGCCTQQQPSQVVATTLPVYEFTATLCQGTNIQVSQLVTEDVSCLHDYTLQVHQMQMLENAEVVVTSGAGLDAFITDAIPESAVCIDASYNIELLCSDAHHEHEHEHEHEHKHGNEHSEADPHIWLSPANAKIMVKNIYDGLLTTYPEHQAVFTQNLQQLNSRLDELQQYGTQELANLSNRNCITFHDGFAYLADAFDLHILHAIEEESGSEASAQEIIQLISLINTHNITALFTERNSTASSAAIISRETGVAVYELDMAISGNSYFDAMYHNIHTLKEALQ